MFGCVCKAHYNVMWEAARPVSLTTAVRCQGNVNMVNHNWLAGRKLVMQLLSYLSLGRKTKFVFTNSTRWNYMTQCFEMTYYHCKKNILTLQELLDFPSAGYTRGRSSCTRGNLPRVQHSGKSLRLILPRERRLPRVSKIVHSGKALPSAVLALGEDLTPLADDRRRFFYFLPRVQHSGKIFEFFF